ncbi:MAG TPA: helix-turn-helix transcriptional regulator [Trueperaceae bacterium]|nr:helix-turn-helix transcriptional regulator [Trueperaceae bacterium]
MSKSKVFNRLRVLRTERGLSRQDVADAVGVNWQTIGYLEREDYNPSLALGFKLAEFFEVPVDALFSLRPLPPLKQALGGVSTSSNQDTLDSGEVTS